PSTLSPLSLHDALPIWPRDYLSSFLKIGTIALLVVGVILANPTLQCPPVNDVFRTGGPTFAGHIFPFVFICIMCGKMCPAKVGRSEEHTSELQSLAYLV